MMLQKTLIVGQAFNELENRLNEIIKDGGRVDNIVANTHSRGGGWLIVYTPIHR
jgi:hypothetical protein